MTDPSAAPRAVIRRLVWAIGPQAPSVDLFRLLWATTLVANIGNAMGSVGAGWLMTTLSPSPVMVAAVQAATSLPLALLALPGGALADIVDRRRMLLAVTTVGMIPPLALTLGVIAGIASPSLLLCMTFLGASGVAVCAPAFLAVTGEMVPRALLPQALALGALGNSLTRAIGPLLGGLLIAAAGTPCVFFIDAVSAIGVVLVLTRWRPEKRPQRQPPEHLVGAVRAGFRYVHSSRPLHAVLVRCIAYFVCASALWSLLPLLARHQLALGPTGYGALLTVIGVGAVTGSIAWPWLARRVTPNRLSITAPLLLASAVAAMSVSNRSIVAFVLALPAGFGWSLMSGLLQSAFQMGAAAWVRARALGIFLMVSQGALSVGSVVWGLVASELGVAHALLFAAFLTAVGVLVAGHYVIEIQPDLDFTPSGHWPIPRTDHRIAEEDAPVLVTIEYRVDPATTQEFSTRLRQLRRIRMRDGAMRWKSWIDVADSARIFETFIVPSWLEHLRQHERVTHADSLVQEAVVALHTRSTPPLVNHWISLD